VNFTDKEIDELIKGVFDGEIDKENLPENLYTAIAEFLQGGLYKGFGGSVADFGGKDLDLLEDLRTNIYMFSAAKTYDEVRTLQDKMYDSDNNIKPFKDFYEDAVKTYDQYNKNYAETEYNTALASGEMAAKWNQIEAEKDLFPLLKMTVVEDAQTTEICEPLDGITLPINDPFWDEFYPPNHWNCRSTVLQLDEGEVSSKSEVNKAKEHADEDMQDVFKMNVGKDGYVFSPEHPYFLNSPPELGRENFGLPLPEVSRYDVGKRLKENIQILINSDKDFDTLKLFTDKSTGDFLQSRTDFHKELVNNYISSNGGTTKRGTSYFMGGAPATGKSSLLETGVVKLPKGILKVDPDAIKKMIPEYNGMVEKNVSTAAHKVHEESSILSKSIVKTVAKAKGDIVMDGVGDGEYDKLVKKVLEQREAGKKVEAHYITTNVEESVKRATKRASETGREVPEAYIRDMHREISKLVPKLAENGVFDVLKLYDNNVARGEKPILIFEQIGGKIKIHNKVKYNAFLAQAK